jgi:tRNA (mo5U34)-methyltransferase
MNTKGLWMIAPPSTSHARLQNEIAALGHWFHNLHLPDGTQTAPHHSLGDFPAYKWKHLSPHIPRDLTGWKVLDIGCNAGFYTFELAKRGAKVTGIDSNAQYLAQAQWAARQFSLEDRVTLRRMQVYDLAGVDETFDLVLFMGVFYHLRYPTLALDIVAQRVGRMLVFQTLTMPGKEVYSDTDGLDFETRQPMLEAGWPKMAFIEHRFAGDPTNWWAPNHACVEAIMRTSGLQVTAALPHELYLCAPDPDHPSCVTTWNAEELLSAIGANRCGAAQ